MLEIYFYNIRLKQKNMPKFSYPLIFFFLLLFPERVVAQQYILKGKVVNQLQQPVEFVQISLLKKTISKLSDKLLLIV